MFFLDNDVPLTMARVAMWSLATAQEDPTIDSGRTPFKAWGIANEATWDLCQKVRNKYVILPSGSKALVSNDLFATNKPAMPLNEHISLYTGTVGSGWGDNIDWYMQSDGEEIITGSDSWNKVTYGHFMHCHIAIGRSEFDQHLADQYSSIGLPPPGKIELDALSEQPRGPGRPKKYEGAIEMVVSSEFLIRSNNGKIPLGKKDAVIVEAIEWVLARFGEKVSRTAMQRYLRPVFDAQK